MGLADELQKLEDLRKRGTLTQTEFDQAKAVLLNSGTAPADPPLGQHLSEHLAEVRFQNELARIDREWELKQQQYLVADRYGRRHVPKSGMGIGVAVVGGVIGVIWTTMAIFITSTAPDFGPFAIARIAFPLFGVVFTLVAIGLGVHLQSCAQKYNAAFRAYQSRRRQVIRDKFHGQQGDVGSGNGGAETGTFKSGNGDIQHY